ncbi:MAG: radical SAM protein [bacterium]|nr:radical SAM protein [bacterium]
MKILLISPNQVFFSHRVTPLGLLYLAAGLREKGHEIRLVDLMFSKNELGDIEKAVKEFNPQVVGMSIRNVDTIITKDKSFVSYYRACVDTIRANSDAVLIAGGAGFSNYPEPVMEGLEADFGIVGEADNSFPQLLECIENKKDWSGIPGLIYLKGKKLVSNPPDFVQDLDAIPFQAIDLIDHKKYKRNRGFFGIMTKKSCTQRCSFCNDSNIHGDCVRLRSPSRVVDEIEYVIKKTGMKYFDFADALYNSPRNHAADILREIIKRKVKFKFKVELNPLGHDDEFVRLLKEAGCMGVDYTADAGSEKMFKSYNKGFTGQMIQDVAKLYVKHKIPYSIGFLLGGPGEDIDTITETIEFANKLPKVKIVYFSVGVILLKDAPMERIAERASIVKSPGDIVEVRYYLSDDFNEECAEKILEACRKNNKFYVSDTFFIPLMGMFWKMLDIINLRPVWKYGSLTNISLRALKFGKEYLYWDNEERRYKAS